MTHEQDFSGASSARPDPVSVLEEQAKTRVPDLAPVRYGRMLTSASAYYCGAATPMAWDLGHMATPDLRVQCCGDAHLLNFGMFAAPDRPARDNGLKEGAGFAAARRCASSYRTEMARFAVQRRRREIRKARRRTSLKAMTRFCDLGANPRPRLTGPLLPAEGAQRRVEDP